MLPKSIINISLGQHCYFQRIVYDIFELLKTLYLYIERCSVKLMTLRCAGGLSKALTTDAG